MFEAINGMMLDMLAAIARKDYEDRRRRQYQGQARAKAAGKYQGRPENMRRNKHILQHVDERHVLQCDPGGHGCSRATVAKISKRRRSV